MKKILIVTAQTEHFSTFMDGLKQTADVDIATVDSSEKAEEQVAAGLLPDLIVIDETINNVPGLTIARNILMKNAMANPGPCQRPLRRRLSRSVGRPGHYVPAAAGAGCDPERKLCWKFWQKCPNIKNQDKGARYSMIRARTQRTTAPPSAKKGAAASQSLFRHR